MTRILLLLTLLSRPAFSHAADWLQFRGPNGSGAAPAMKLPLKWSKTENIVLTIPLPGAGTSSPLIMGERIYVTCYTGYNVPGQAKGNQADLKRHLLCIDGKTGKTIWNTAVNAKLPEQESIRDSHGYASNTPTADADAIYCFFGKSGVYAFSHDGKELWQADVGDKLNGWGSASSPILHGDLVIVNASVESESLVALDRKTGKERWRAKGIRESWSTPVIAKNPSGQSELLVPIFGKILAFNPTTGEPLWNCATNITWYMVPGIVVNDGVAYSLGGRSGVVGLAVKLGGNGDVTKSHRLWTIQKGTNVSSPVIHQKHLYWMNDNNETAYCAEAETGKLVYEERISRAGQIYASSLLVGDRIYYLSRDGRTSVVAAKPTYELLATNDLKDGSLFHATPVAVNDQLYIRSDKALYIIGQK